MNDFLVDLAKRPTTGFLLKKLPFKVDLPPVLERTDAAWDDHALAGKRHRVVRLPGTRLGATLDGILSAAGSVEARDGGPDLFVADATGAAAPADLAPLYEALHGAVPALQAGGRIVVVGRRPDSIEDAAAAATQEALTGLARSLAKEIGKKGATAHLVQLPSGEEGDLARRLAWPLVYLLSPRAAFVSGQVFPLANRLGAPAGLAWSRPLQGKRALVTGAARGIGLAIAKSLAREGAIVLGVDHPVQAEALASAMAALGGEALTLDLMEESAIPALLERLESSPIDILVNNAGITRDKTIGRMSRESWDAVLRLNLDVPVRLTTALWETEKLSPGARVVLLSSVVGLAGNRGQTNYAASKAGLVGFARSIAPLLAARGSTINAVAPGFIDTPMTRQIPVVTREVGRRLSSLKQGGLAEDVAHAVTFLSLPGSYALTGATVRVCGQALLGA